MLSGVEKVINAFSNGIRYNKLTVIETAINAAIQHLRLSIVLVYLIRTKRTIAIMNPMPNLNIPYNIFLLSYCAGTGCGIVSELGLAHLRLENRQGLKAHIHQTYIGIYCFRGFIIPLNFCSSSIYNSIFYWSFDNNRNNSFMSFSISSVSEYSDAFAFKSSFLLMTPSM